MAMSTLSTWNESRASIEQEADRHTIISSTVG